MTQRMFDKLPLLMSRRQVAKCGIGYYAIDSMSVDVAPNTPVPAGKLGAVRITGKYRRYLKSSVARIVGLKV